MFDNVIIIIVFLTTIVKKKAIFYNILKGGSNMITYEPFWDSLSRSKESTYTLINKHHISSSTIDKLRKNKPLNTTTINDLCRILDCKVEQIMRYTPTENEQVL